MDYLAELQPTYRLIADAPPPRNTRLIFLTKYGIATISDYHPEYGFKWWCPLPKLTPEQKKEINGKRND